MKKYLLILSWVRIPICKHADPYPADQCQCWFMRIRRTSVDFLLLRTIPGEKTKCYLSPVTNLKTRDEMHEHIYYILVPRICHRTFQIYLAKGRQEREYETESCERSGQVKGLCEGGEARTAWRQIQRIASSHRSNIGASPFSYSPPKKAKRHSMNK